MELEPILAVWGGLYLDGEIISQEDLQPYIDDALNELEFLMVSQVLHQSIPYGPIVNLLLGPGKL